MGLAAPAAAVPKAESRQQHDHGHSTHVGLPLRAASRRRHGQWVLGVSRPPPALPVRRGLRRGDATWDSSRPRAPAGRAVAATHAMQDGGRRFCHVRTWRTSARAHGYSLALEATHPRRSPSCQDPPLYIAGRLCAPTGAPTPPSGCRGFRRPRAGSNRRREIRGCRFRHGGPRSGHRGPGRRRRARARAPGAR